MRTRLIRSISNVTADGPSRVFRPSEPAFPGAGFTRTGRPWESTIALLLNAPLSALSEETPATDGSVICRRSAKYVGTLPGSLVTFPSGSTPTISGVLLVVVCQIVETGAVMERGA